MRYFRQNIVHNRYGNSSNAAEVHAITVAREENGGLVFASLRATSCLFRPSCLFHYPYLLAKQTLPRQQVSLHYPET
jgi:hypothetical protein